MKLLSIIIPYYNRRQLLLNTLKSIQYFKGNAPIEIIIVDDGSSENQNINNLSEMFHDLNITVLVIRGCGSAWRTPAIAYNAGFNVAKGDIFMLNSCDCIHVGSIIDFIIKDWDAKSYFSFATFSVNSILNDFFDNIDWSKPDIFNLILRTLDNFKDGWWRSHSIKNRWLIPFCAVIGRENMEALSGYDERFTTKNGIGFDDCDFIDRVANLGLNMRLIDSPFCVHQHHELISYTNTINRDFLQQLVATEPNRVKAPQNKIYVR